MLESSTLTPPPPSTSPLPECVVLHPEDAQSKVFHCIARALLAVDNRALTVKDLAEAAMAQGMQAQSVSAASQAITTYIRLHLDRCQKQNDIPLLFQHRLSGTELDDALVSALASKSGGASGPLELSSHRATNFRKGTVVWFLSRATGVPCPFTRAGIRLCDYTERTPVFTPQPQRDRRSTRERQPDPSTLKRKRTLRGSSPSASHSDAERPPPKVRITLRLKPIPSATPASGPVPKTISSRIINISDSDDDDDDSDTSMFPQSQAAPRMDSECLPPYPRRSISIPCYTPSVEKPYLYFPPAQSQQSSSSSHVPYRRSPSAALSAASPPPDSDDEMVFDESLSPSRLSAAASFQPPLLEDDSDFDADSEGDADTSWEELSLPRSPSTSSLLPPVRVKREADIHPFSTSWEVDDVLGAHTSAYESEVTAKIKTEVVELESWAWDKGYQGYFADDEGSLPIKQEEPPQALSSLDLPYQSAPSPSSSSSTSDAFTDTSAIPARPRANTEPSPFAQDTVHWTDGPLPGSLASLIESMGVTDALHEPCVSPQECTASNVVTASGLPQDAPITATQIEGIPVYQMPAATFNLLRRIDTDFVNLDTIAAYAGTPLPVWSTIPTATPVIAGSPWIMGTWVSLSTAQEYVHDHCPTVAFLNVFLSDDLHQYFPSLRQTRQHADNNNSPLSVSPFGLTVQSPIQLNLAPAFLGSSSVMARPNLFASVPVPDIQLISRGSAHSQHHAPLEDFPLSPTEQEMFHALCWGDEQHITSATVAIPTADSADQISSSAKQTRDERPGLRRSKRVAAASHTTPTTMTSTSRSQQRSRRAGSRNSV